MEITADTRIIATEHAISQYDNKVARFMGGYSTNEETAKLLCDIVRFGKETRELPGEPVEMEYKGIYAAVVWNGEAFLVITCNGDTAWRHWWRNKEVWHRYKRKLRAAL